MFREKESSADELNGFRESIDEEVRPWGKFRSFPYENATSLKIITIKPGCALSLQYHNHRSEFWVVLDEGLEITVGDRTWQPRKNEEVFIARKTPHRIRSIGENEARVFEIWIGKSTESDIVRLQDDFGRI